MEQKKYQDNYPEGSYKLRVLDNTIHQSNSGNFSVLLNCEVVSVADKKTGNGTTIIFGGKRKVNLYCTPKTIEGTKTFLKHAGFDGKPSLLAHTHPNHVSIAGFEFNASCKHQKSDDGTKTYDRFQAYPIKEGSGKSWSDSAKVPDEIECMNFDNLFNSAVVFPVNTETPEPSAQNTTDEYPW